MQKEATATGGESTLPLTFEQYEAAIKDLQEKLNTAREERRTKLVGEINDRIAQLGGLKYSEDEQVAIVLKPFAEFPEAIVTAVVGLLSPEYVNQFHNNLLTKNISDEYAKKLYRHLFMNLEYLPDEDVIRDLYNTLKPKAATTTGKTKERGKQKPGTDCDVCKFATEPDHNGRQHRFQGADKERFTDDELKSGTIKKDGVPTVFKRISEPKPCSVCGSTDHGDKGHALAIARLAGGVAEEVLGEEPQSEGLGQAAIDVAQDAIRRVPHKKAKAKK